jgi:hypothetical protein
MEPYVIKGTIDKVFREDLTFVQEASHLVFLLATTAVVVSVLFLVHLSVLSAETVARWFMIGLIAVLLTALVL